MFKSFQQTDDFRSLNFRGFPTKNYSGRSNIVLPSCWLDANDVVNSVVKDGSGFVSEWKDKQGSLIKFGQSTAAYRPVWRDSIINGLPIIDFDGVDDYLIRSGSLIVSNIIIVSAFSGGEPWTDYKSLMSAATPSSYFFTGAPSSYNLISNIWGAIDVNRSGNAIFSPFSEFKIIEGKTSANYSYTDVYIGTDRIVAGRWWFGGIAEILIFDKYMRQEDRDYWVNYLSAKYNIILG